MLPPHARFGARPPFSVRSGRRMFCAGFSLSDLVVTGARSMGIRCAACSFLRFAACPDRRSGCFTPSCKQPMLMFSAGWGSGGGSTSSAHFPFWPAAASFADRAFRSSSDRRRTSVLGLRSRTTLFGLTVGTPRDVRPQAHAAPIAHRRSSRCITGSMFKPGYSTSVSAFGEAVIVLRYGDSWQRAYPARTQQRLADGIAVRRHAPILRPHSGSQKLRGFFPTQSQNTAVGKFVPFRPSRARQRVPWPV